MKTIRKKPARRPANLAGEGPGRVGAAAEGAPGAWQPLVDRWGPLASHEAHFPRESLVLVDRRVARLHPSVGELVRAVRPRAVLAVTAGEGAKSLARAMKALELASRVPRGGAVVCVGGGTVGDLATVVAHLLKRGVRLIQVPSTLLAAVDSSVGGKGALHVASGGQVLKNAIGVFHYADECWLCPELFATLSERQLREGATEAWKMAVCLDPARWGRWIRRRPSLIELVRESRAMKAEVCARDPYERSGRRSLLNFGHTFGHVFESLSGFRVSHGDAVGLGVLCALDVGRALGRTPASVADAVERAFLGEVGTLGRDRMARVLEGASRAAVGSLLAGDKKSGLGGQLRMVLLVREGDAVVEAVPTEEWVRLLRAWKLGSRP